MAKLDTAIATAGPAKTRPGAAVLRHPARGWALALAFGVWICVSAVAAAAPLAAVVVDAALDPLPLAGAVEVLEDPEGSLSLDEVLGRRAPDFVPPGKTNLGLTGSTYWVRFAVVHEGPEKLQRTLVMRRTPSLYRVDAYVISGSGVPVHHRHGSTVPFAERPLDTIDVAFPLSLSTGVSTQVLMRIDAGGMPLQVEPQLWSPRGFLRQVQIQQVLLWTWYGIFAIMGLYHLIVFLAVRERSYLHFAGFALGGVGMDICLEGPAQQLLSPGNPDIAAGLFLPFAMLMSGSTLTFTRSVLDARTHPAWHAPW